MRVAEFMTPEPVTIDAGANLDVAMRSMDDNDVRHLPVLDGGKLVGLISDRDVLGATGWLPTGLADTPDHVPPSGHTVRDVMHGKPITAGPEDSVVMVSVELVLRGIGCVPVVEDGAVVGIVSELDVLRMYRKAVDEHWMSGVEDPIVATCMTKDAVTVAPDTTSAEARELLHSLDVRHLPVVEDGAVVGVVSDRDLRRAHGRSQPDEAAIGGFMTRHPVEIAPSDPMSKAARVLGERKISSLPVVQDGKLVGILTITDVLDHCMNAVRRGDLEPSGS